MKTAIVVVRILPDEREALERAAKDNERTMSAEIRLALRRHLAAEGAPGDGT